MCEVKEKVDSARKGAKGRLTGCRILRSLMHVLPQLPQDHDEDCEMDNEQDCDYGDYEEQG